MPEQETEQPQELEETSHPFDTELNVLEDGPADVDDASDDVVEDIAAEEKPSVETEDATAAGEEPVAAEPDETANEPEPDAPARSTAEVMAIAEAIIFVSDEPITSKALGDIIGENKETIQAAVEELQREYEERDGGLQIREIAGGWQIATRTEYHEEVRKFLKTRPSAKLSLAALETLAVIAYKQPVTVPEILEIRGVQSASAIKTLLEKRLIVTKGHKETVGRPMMYGTSKDFLIQFGLKDLTDLPSIEDFEDLVQSS